MSILLETQPGLIGEFTFLLIFIFLNPAIQFRDAKWHPPTNFSQNHWWNLAFRYSTQFSLNFQKFKNQEKNFFFYFFLWGVNSNRGNLWLIMAWAWAALWFYNRMIVFPRFESSAHSFLIQNRNYHIKFVIRINAKTWTENFPMYLMG